jgi:putative tryptophan/tyrosine transport system substrate-binding protein
MAKGFVAVDGRDNRTHPRPMILPDAYVLASAPIGRRRAVLGILAFTAAFGHARAQEAGRVYRLGIVRPNTPDAARRVELALARRGFVEGRNLVVQHRFAEGRLDALPALARDLVQTSPDVILAVGAAATRAVRDASSTIPIVMFGNFDPVAHGFVASLARPGTNVTGVLIGPEGTLAAKKLELLKETVPNAARIAFLAADDPNMNAQIEETLAAARALALSMPVVTVKSAEYASAFQEIAAAQPDALFVGAHTYFMRDRATIIRLAAQHRMAAIYEWPDQVEEGGLMSYGPNLGWAYERIADYIDRVLKGTSPRDIPVEQPSNVELVINLATARAMELAIPPAVLLRADRVIE